MSIEWPKEEPEQPKQPEPPSVKETPAGQPIEPPKDTAEELIRRFYTGGLAREEFEARMQAIGASLDDVVIEQQPIINPEPDQPGADAARKYPGAEHKLADVEE